MAAPASNPSRTQQNADAATGDSIERRPYAARARQVLLDYLEFCARHELDDTTDAVMLWLADAFERHGPSGAQVRRRLRLLDYAWQAAGRRAPSRDRHIRAFLTGLHQEAALGPAGERTPLYSEDVRQIIDTIRADSAPQWRDVCLLLLANATGLSATGLSRLAWTDVRIRKDRLVLDVDSRGFPPRLQVLASEWPQTLQAFRTLRRLTGPSDRAVFARYDWTNPGTWTISERLRELPGRGANPGRKKVQSVAENDLATSVQTLLRPTPKQLRDTALILIGFSACLTREEARDLRFGNVARASRGLVLRLPRRRQPVGVPVGRDPYYDPVQAWDEWVQEAVAQGRQLQEPAFLEVKNETVLTNRHTKLTQIVAERARAAGLVGDYCFTSLRHGFIRTAVREGVPIVPLLMQTDLRSPESIVKYSRREQLLTHNVLRALGL